MSTPFVFDGSRVDRSVFEPDLGSGYPVIIWHGKYTGGSPDDSGFWSISKESYSEPMGANWSERAIRFGSDPNVEPEPVWATERLRVCVIGVRKRLSVTSDSGAVFHYPLMTKREERVDGKGKVHYQVAVVTPDSADTVFMLSLKGMSKTKAWANPASGKWADSRFPTGVEPLLNGYVKRVGKEIGAPIPTLCSFWIDLVPLRNEKGKKAYVDVGYGTHVTIFTANFDTGGSTGLDHRFVGMELFLRLQELRKAEIVAWEDAWNKSTSSPDSAEPSNPYALLPTVDEDEDGVAF